MAQTGLLDNKTILRFSHALSGGGGVEVHIDNLNRMLLSRNAVKILYLYLPEEDGVEITEESAGRGLWLVPLRVDRSSSVPFRRSQPLSAQSFISFSGKPTAGLSISINMCFIRQGSRCLCLFQGGVRLRRF